MRRGQFVVLFFFFLGVLRGSGRVKHGGIILTIGDPDPTSLLLILGSRVLFWIIFGSLHV